MNEELSVTGLLSNWILELLGYFVFGLLGS